MLPSSSSSSSDAPPPRSSLSWPPRQREEDPHAPRSVPPPWTEGGGGGRRRHWQQPPVSFPSVAVLPRSSTEVGLGGTGGDGTATVAAPPTTTASAAAAAAATADDPADMLRQVLRYSVALSGRQLQQLGPHLDRALRQCPATDITLARQVGMWRALQRLSWMDPPQPSTSSSYVAVVPTPRGGGGENTPVPWTPALSAACQRPMWEWLLGGGSASSSGGDLRSPAAQWESQAASAAAESAAAHSSSDAWRHWMQLWPNRLVAHFDKDKDADADASSGRAMVPGVRDRGDGRRPPAKRPRTEVVAGAAAAISSARSVPDDRWKVALAYVFHHWAHQWLRQHTDDANSNNDGGTNDNNTDDATVQKLVWDLARDFPRRDLLGQAVAEAQAWYALDHDGPLAVDEWLQRWLDKLAERTRLPRRAAAALLVEKLLDRYYRTSDPSLLGAIERLAPPEWEVRQSYPRRTILTATTESATAVNTLTTSTTTASSKRRRREVDDGYDVTDGGAAVAATGDGGDPARSDALHPLYLFRVQMDAWLLLNRWASAVELAVSVDHEDGYTRLWLYLLQRGDLFRKVPLTESPLKTLVPFVTPDRGLRVVVNLYRTLLDLAQADPNIVLAPDERDYVVRNCRDFLRVLTQPQPSAGDTPWRDDSVIPPSLRMERERGRIAPDLRSMWDRLHGLAVPPASIAAAPDADARAQLLSLPPPHYPVATAEAAAVARATEERTAKPSVERPSDDEANLRIFAAVAATASESAGPGQPVPGTPVRPEDAALPPDEEDRVVVENHVHDNEIPVGVGATETEQLLSVDDDGEDQEDKDEVANDRIAVAAEDCKGPENLAEDEPEREPYESEDGYDSEGDEDNPIELRSNASDDEGEAEEEDEEEAPDEQESADESEEDHSGGDSEQEDEREAGIAIGGSDVGDEDTEVEDEEAMSVDEEAPSPSHEGRMSTDNDDDAMLSDEDRNSPAKSSSNHDSANERSIDAGDAESVNDDSSDEGYENQLNRETEEGYEAEDSQEHSDEEEDRATQQVLHGVAQGGTVLIAEEAAAAEVIVSIPPPLTSPLLDPGYEAEDSQHTDEDQPSARRRPQRSFEAGYEAEDSQGHTEEEEEVMQSDDEGAAINRTEVLEPESSQQNVEDLQRESQPPGEDEHTLSDMSAADEATEDQDAESSEVEDVEAASSDQVTLPVSPGPLSTSGQAVSLGDYARSAMSEMPTSAFRTRPSGRSFHSAASDMATGGAMSQAASLESGDELDNDENKGLPMKAVVDHVPDELEVEGSAGSELVQLDNLRAKGESKSLLESEIMEVDKAEKLLTGVAGSSPRELNPEGLSSIPDPIPEPKEDGAKALAEGLKVAEKLIGSLATDTPMEPDPNVRTQLSAPEDMVAVRQAFADESATASPEAPDELTLGGFSPLKPSLDMERSPQQQIQRNSCEIRHVASTTDGDDAGAGDINEQFEEEAVAAAAVASVIGAAGSPANGDAYQARIACVPPDKSLGETLDAADVPVVSLPSDLVEAPLKDVEELGVTKVDDTDERTPVSEALTLTVPPRTRSRAVASAQSDTPGSGVRTRSRARSESMGSNPATTSQPAIPRPSRRTPASASAMEPIAPRTGGPPPKALRPRSQSRQATTPIEAPVSSAAELSGEKFGSDSQAPLEFTAPRTRDRSRQQGATPASAIGPTPSTRRSTRSSPFSAAASDTPTTSGRPRRSSRTPAAPGSSRASTPTSPGLTRQNSGVARHTRSHDPDPPATHTRSSERRRSARKGAGYL